MSALKNRQRIYFWWKKEIIARKALLVNWMVNPTLSNISPSRCNYVIAGYGYECLVTSSHLTRQKSPKYISLEDLPKRSFFVSQALRCMTYLQRSRTHLTLRKQWSAVSLQSSFCTRCPIKIHRVCLPKFDISIPPFLSFSVECVSWYWVGRSDWKKKTLKKISE